MEQSKDKGLYPMLKFIQRKINKFIVEQINPDFEFVFMGLNGMTISEELDMDIKRLQAFQTVDEIREKWDLPAIGEEKGGDTIENSVIQQAISAKQQQQQQAAMGGMGGGNPFEEAAGMGMEAGDPADQPVAGGEDEEDAAAQPGNPFDLYAEGDQEETMKARESNPLVAAFDEYLQKAIHHDE